MENPPLQSTTSSRAGRYVNQSTGYRAFIPEPLPPNPPIQVADELQVMLSQADFCFGLAKVSISAVNYRAAA